MPTNNYAYMTGSFDPWQIPASNPGSPDSAMNTAFGAGHWDKFQGFSASAFTAGYKFIYLDGGDGDSDQFRAFVSANLTAIQTYVAGGGHLFLNEAGWTESNFNLGFGVTTHWGPSATASAADAAAPIFTTATGTSWSGGYFAHEYVTGAGLHTLINGTAGSVLADMNYGAGHVAFGGMTDPYFDSPGAAADALRANILKYEADVVTAPPAPGALALDAASDSGAVGDHLTNVRQIVVDGTAAAGSTVTLYDSDGKTVIATGTASASGVFQLTTSALADGTHDITATATLNGATSPASAALDVTIDATAPLAPAVTLADDTGVSATDGITRDPAISVVTAEPGGTVAYSLDGGAYSASVPGLARDGSQDGHHTISVEQTDAAGNVSDAGVVSFTLDTIAPAAPAVALAHDTGVSGSDGLTNDATVAVTTAEAGGTLAYSLDGGAYAASAPVLAHDGSQDGQHTISVEQTDAAGNVSSAGVVSFTLDTVAPGAPAGLTLDSATDSAAKGDNLTNVRQVQIDGTAEANSQVVLYDTDGVTVIGQGAADATGAFHLVTGALADGVHDITASATDAAGNVSAVSAALAVTVDTTAPQPSITDIVQNPVGDGALITGLSEPGRAVSLFDHGVLVGTATAGADGAFSLVVTAPGNTIHAYTEQATDAAGNTGSSAGSAFYVTAANKTLVGTSGDDVLVGRPNDVLTGGAGHDRFVFNTDFGRETVTDFTPGGAGGPGDTLVFDHRLFGSGADVLAHAAQVGANTVITFDPGDTVTLKGVSLASLHTSDFLFI